MTTGTARKPVGIPTVQLKSDWVTYLHALRARELDIAFDGCPSKAFATGLEIGAGDAFQAHLLTRYVSRLVSTDYYPDILANQSTEALRFKVCDAEALEQHFGPAEFELIFSSNVLEHIVDPQRALRACYNVLAGDGILIHVLPTPFWKLCHVLFHTPNLAIQVVERLTGRGGFGWLWRKLTGRVASLSDRPRDSNPKTIRAPRRLWARVLLPEPHGISRTNRAEFAAFSRVRWEGEFRRAGFEVVDVRKGPVASGYGFGLDGVRNVVERLGLSSESIYILAKPGASRRLRRHFEAGRVVKWSRNFDAR